MGKANQRLKCVVKVEKSLAKDNGRRELEVNRLKVEASKAKSISVTEFKKSEAYSSSLTSTAAMFLTKSKVKMERVLQRHHYIEDLSYLAHMANEPTFFGADDDKVEEEGEEVYSIPSLRGLALSISVRAIGTNLFVSVHWAIGRRCWTIQ